MNIRTTTLAAALALVLGGTAFAQDASEQTPAAAGSSAAANSVGSWLHDGQGNTIGSVRSVSQDGRTAVIMIGSYFEPGSHEATVPADDITVSHNQARLQTSVVEALNADHLN